MGANSRRENPAKFFATSYEALPFHHQRTVRYQFLFRKIAIGKPDESQGRKLRRCSEIEPPRQRAEQDSQSRRFIDFGTRLATR
jgi:hypothetical protein